MKEKLSKNNTSIAGPLVRTAKGSTCHHRMLNLEGSLECTANDSFANNVTIEQCNNVTIEQCNNVTIEQCNNVTIEQCNTVELKQCNTDTMKQSSNEVKKQCNIETMKQSSNKRKGRPAKKRGFRGFTVKVSNNFENLDIEKQINIETDQPKVINADKLVSKVSNASASCKTDYKISRQGKGKTSKVSTTRISGTVESNQKKPCVSSFNNNLFKSFPFGLKNKGQNICFLNSVLQVFYRIPVLYDEVMSNRNINSPVSGIKDIFQEIEQSDQPVETYKHIFKLQIPRYQAKQQEDCHECLVYLLNEIFPSLSTVDSFNVQTFQSVVCDNRDCNYSSDKITCEPILPLRVIQTFEDQTISQMIQRSLYRHQLPDFRCQTCHSIGNCYKTDTIVKLPDILFIQLKLFSYNNDGSSEKIVPNLNIDESLSLYGKTLNLSAIIYHDGPNTASGHYTSSIKINETWFTINDTKVSEGAKFFCLSTEITTPYLLIYKIEASVTNAIRNNFTTTSESTVYQNSIASKKNETSSTFINNPIDTAESKLRRSMINEVNMQKDRIELIKRKKEAQNITCISKSPIKRKTRYTRKNAQSKEIERIRKANVREVLDESSKQKIKACDKKGR